jgi:hypothetical protein
MMEALISSETSLLTRATRHNIPEDAILLLTICYNYNNYSLCPSIGHPTFAITDVLKSG